jgi:hemolysin D
MLIEDKSARMPSGLSHPVIWTLSIFLFVIFVWSLIGELDVVSSTRGRVISEGQIKSVQSSVSSTIKRIVAKEGDFVKSGDVLFELDDIVFSSEVAALTERIAQLQTELSRLRVESGAPMTIMSSNQSARDDERFNAQQSVRLTRQVSLAQKRNEVSAVLESRRAALESGISSAEGFESRLKLASEKEQRALPYVELSVSRFQYLQWKDDVLALQKELASQRATNNRLVRDIEEARQRFLQVQSGNQEEIAREISEKRSIQAQLQSELTKASKRLADCIVRTPQDGIIQNVLVTTTGASITSNEVLARVVPSNTRLVIEVLIPNEEKGYLQAGQPVDIKLDAFPFQKYGRLSGKLEWISPDAELSTSSNISLLTQAAQLRTLNNFVPQYVYKGRVVAFADTNQTLKLAPGLTAQVDILTDRRRILDFFLFPLRKTVGEALLVR